MTDFKFLGVPNIVKNLPRRKFSAMLLLLAGSSSVLLLSGCSSAFKAAGPQPTNTVEFTGLKGKIHGGNNPVSGSTVNIYDVVGTGAGYGALVTSLASTTTDSNGNWSLNGKYTCPAGDYVYVVANGGNPGLSGNPNNAALYLTAALGPCSNIANVGFVFIDEVTTVATAYSLAGFMSDFQHVGTSTSNTIGLQNAFATFNNLVNLNTGQARTVTPGYASPTALEPPDTFRGIVPYDTINTLADILANCVNTDGTGSACSGIFALTGDATNTSDAALYVAHNPGLSEGSGTTQNNVGNLYNLYVAAGAPFQPALGQAPPDWTLTLNFTGGGLGGVKTTSRSGATYFAIDGFGNLWIPNNDRTSVTELSNLGAPLSPTTLINDNPPSYTVNTPGGWGATSGDLEFPFEAAVDQNNNVWVSDADKCLVEFNQQGAIIGTFSSVCESGTGAVGVNVDANNHIWVTGSTGTYINSSDNSGNPITGSSFPINGFNSLEGWLLTDYNDNTWYVDSGTGEFGSYSATGANTASSPYKLATPGGWAAFGLPLGTTGLSANLTIWLPQPDPTGNIQPISTGTGTIPGVPSSDVPSSFTGQPTGVAVDGLGFVYIAGQTSNLPSNVTVLSSKGATVSPFGTGYTGGSAFTALSDPGSIGIDQSGNLWVLNTNNGNPAPTGGQYSTVFQAHSNVTEFVGLAAPVNPVFQQAAANKTYGTEP